MNWETYKFNFPKIMILYWLGSQGANIVLKQALKSALLLYTFFTPLRPGKPDQIQYTR